MVLELGRTPTELCFRVGPGAGANATFTRDNAGADPRVAAAFGVSRSLTEVRVGAGTLTATIDDASHWPDELLVLFDTIAAHFAPPRAAPRGSPARTRAKPSWATSGTTARVTSRGYSTRRLHPTCRSGGSRWSDSRARSPRSASRPWARGLEDSSRVVRRVTARVLAETAQPATRDLLERALGRRRRVRALLGRVRALRDRPRPEHSRPCNIDAPTPTSG